MLLFEFAAINSMVSLQYETNEQADCISLISGVNLCKAIKKFHLLVLIFGLTLIGFLMYRDQLLNQIKEIKTSKDT